MFFPKPLFQNHSANQNEDHQLGLNQTSEDSCKKIIYSCECGKSYMSFPALYFHGSVKHAIKFSSNSKRKQWKTREKGKYIERLFFLQDGIENFEDEPQHQFFIQNRLPRASRIILQQNEINIFEKIKLKFLEASIHLPKYEPIVLNFFQKSKYKWGNKPTKENINMLPYELNDYAVEQMPKFFNERIQSQQWKQGCVQLLKLAKWLYDNKHTQYLAVENIQSSH